MADWIGGDGDDYAVGTAEADLIDTGAGIDTLVGGAGNDTLEGGTGGDLYLYSAGDGVDTIIDVAGFGEENVLQLVTPGLLLDDFILTFSGSFLQLKHKTTGDLIQMSGFDPNNAYGPRAIETFISSSGFVMSYNALIDYLEIESTGTAAAEVMTGTNAHDNVFGLGGNDTLSAGVGSDEIYGGDGNDILAGGVGSDLLLGGAGHDT
jgi:Ca2+-binding RTX toxin-like protein